MTELRDLHIQTITSPTLLSALMLDGLRLWFTSQTDAGAALAPEAYPPTLRSLERQHNRLGWDQQLFLGRFRTEWCQHQRQHSVHHHRLNNDLNRLSLTWQASTFNSVGNGGVHFGKRETKKSKGTTRGPKRKRQGAMCDTN